MYGIFSSIKHQTYLLKLTLNQFHWIKFYFISMIVCDCGSHTKLNRDFPDFPPNDMNKYKFFIAYSYPFITIVCNLNSKKNSRFYFRSVSHLISIQHSNTFLFYVLFMSFFSFHCRVSSFWMTDKDICTRVHRATAHTKLFKQLEFKLKLQFFSFFLKVVHC